MNGIADIMDWLWILEIGRQAIVWDHSQDTPLGEEGTDVVVHETWDGLAGAHNEGPAIKKKEDWSVGGAVWWVIYVKLMRAFQ